MNVFLDNLREHFKDKYECLEWDEQHFEWAGGWWGGPTLVVQFVQIIPLAYDEDMTPENLYIDLFGEEDHPEISIWDVNEHVIPVSHFEHVVKIIDTMNEQAARVLRKRKEAASEG